MKLNLDLTGNKVQGLGADLLPEGAYHVKITETEEAGKNNNIGCVVWMEVMAGQYAGSMIKDYLNVAHSNQEAERIGRDCLKTYLAVTGYPNPNACADSDVLHGKELIVRLNQADSTFQDERSGEMKTIKQNNVKKRLEFKGETPADPVATAAPATTAAAPVGTGAEVFGEAKTMFNQTPAPAAETPAPWL